MNAFEVFELPVTLDLDLGELRKLYIQKQQLAHPDHGGEIIDSEIINKSYTLLKNRESRVQLILELNQIDTNDSSTLPQGFLFEMMELSESLESEDSSYLMLKIEELMSASNTEFQELSVTFQNTSENIKKLATWYQKNKYYHRLDKNFKGIHEI